MKRSASAVWQGGLQDGKGSISTESGADAAAFGAAADKAKAGCPISRLLGAAAKITMEARLGVVS
jgi:osmotically inducible protein OsmC